MAVPDMGLVQRGEEERFEPGIVEVCPFGALFGLIIFPKRLQIIVPAIERQPALLFKEPDEQQPVKQTLGAEPGIFALDAVHVRLRRLEHFFVAFEERVGHLLDVPGGHPPGAALRPIRLSQHVFSGHNQRRKIEVPQCPGSVHLAPVVAEHAEPGHALVTGLKVGEPNALVVFRGADEDDFVQRPAFVLRLLPNVFLDAPQNFPQVRATERRLKLR